MRRTTANVTRLNAIANGPTDRQFTNSRAEIVDLRLTRSRYRINDGRLDSNVIGNALCMKISGETMFQDLQFGHSLLETFMNILFINIYIYCSIGYYN